MNKIKREEISLIIKILIIIFIYFVIPLTRREFIRVLKIERMKEFNKLLDQNILSFKTLENLKILIHNYESLEDKEILNSRNEEKLSIAVDILKIKHDKLFLKNTTTLNLLIFGSTLMPSIAFLIKKLVRKQ